MTYSLLMKLPVELVIKIISYCGFPIILELFPKFAHKFYNPEIHNWLWAIRNCHISVLIYLYENKVPGYSANIINTTSAIGNKEITKLLLSFYPNSITDAEDAMDLAASNGHLEIVEYLHGLGAKCSTRAIDQAAGNGHYEIVKFLTLNRNEGCTFIAPMLAIQNGHKHIYQWIDQVYSVKKLY